MRNRKREEQREQEQQQRARERREDLEKEAVAAAVAEAEARLAQERKLSEGEGVYLKGGPAFVEGIHDHAVAEEEDPFDVHTDTDRLRDSDRNLATEPGDFAMMKGGPAFGDYEPRESSIVRNVPASAYAQWRQRPRDTFEQQLARAGVSEEEIYRITRWRNDAPGGSGRPGRRGPGQGRHRLGGRTARLTGAGCSCASPNPNTELINDQNLEDFAQRQIAASWERGQTFDAFQRFRQGELQQEIDRYNQGPPEGLRGWMRRDWFKGRENFFRHLQDRRDATALDLDKRYDREIYQGATRWLEENVPEGEAPNEEDYRQAYEAGKAYQDRQQERRSDRSGPAEGAPGGQKSRTRKK